MELELEQQKELDFFPKGNGHTYTDIPTKKFKREIEKRSIEEIEVLSIYRKNRFFTYMFLFFATNTLLFSIVESFGTNDNLSFSYRIATYIFAGMFFKHSIVCARIRQQKIVSVFNYILEPNTWLPKKLQFYRLK